MQSRGKDDGGANICAYLILIRLPQLGSGDLENSAGNRVFNRSRVVDDWMVRLSAGRNDLRVINLDEGKRMAGEQVGSPREGSVECGQLNRLALQGAVGKQVFNLLFRHGSVPCRA